MTDVERRLRAAMAGSAEPAPAGLLEGVYQRHRRRHRRLAAACAAVVAVAAVGTLVSRGALDGLSRTGPHDGGPAAGPAAVPPATPASTPAAAPGTVLRDCASNNFGTLGRDWKARSVHAGLVWFIYTRPSAPMSHGHGPAAGHMTNSAMIIAVSNGRTAVVTDAPSLHGRFRFLANVNGDGRPFSLAEGAPGLTLSGCPPAPAGTRFPESYAPGLTMFWQGYVTDLRGCIPLDVRTVPGGAAVRVTIAAGNAGCGS